MATKFIKIRLNLLLVLLTIWCANLSVSGQITTKSTLKGKVVDGDNKPLPYATVLLKTDLELKFVKSTITDDNGNFSLSGIVTGNYKLEISMMGFESLSKTGIKITAAPTIDLGVLQLKPSAKLLGMVNITAQKSFIERHADKIVVNVDNPITAGNSIMEVMDKLPGVQVSQDDQLTLNGRAIQIYIDGKLTPLSSEALASLLKGMPAGNIQKIELIAHPSAKYDAAGSGGIINIIKKRNHKEGVSGSLYGGLGQGRYGKQNGGINLNYKNNFYNLFFNADYSFNQYYVDNNIASDYFDGNHVLNQQSTALINGIRTNRTYTPNLGIDLYLSKKTTLSVSATEGVQLFNKNAQSHTDYLTPAAAVTSSTDFMNLVKTNSGNFSSGIHLLHQIDSLGKEYTVDADYYSYSNSTDQNNLNTLYNSAGSLVDNAATLFDQERKFKLYSVKADYSLPLKDNAHLETGLKSSYVKSDNSNLLSNVVGGTPVPDASQDDYFKYLENIDALYVTYSKDYKKLTYQLGLRGEYTWGKGEQIKTGETFNRSYLQLFPSAYFDYKLTADNGLNLSLNKMTDRPTYENLNPLVRIINSTTYLQGNPDLKPVVSYNSSLTYAYKNSLFCTFNYSVSLHDIAYFTTPYNGSTTAVTTQPGNNLNTKYLSLIIAYSKQLKPWWFISSNINLNRQYFKAESNAPDLYNSGMLAFNFDTYNSFAVTKKFSFLVLFKYRSKNQDKNITNDPYFVLTSGVRQQLLKNKASLALNVTDIFHSYKVGYIQNSASITQKWNNLNETTVARLSFTYAFGGKIKKPKTSDGAVDEKNRSNLKEN